MAARYQLTFVLRAADEELGYREMWFDEQSDYLTARGSLTNPESTISREVARKTFVPGTILVLREEAPGRAPGTGPVQEIGRVITRRRERRVMVVDHWGKTTVDGSSAAHEEAKIPWVPRTNLPEDLVAWLDKRRPPEAWLKEFPFFTFAWRLPLVVSFRTPIRDIIRVVVQVARMALGPTDGTDGAAGALTAMERWANTGRRSDYDDGVTAARAWLRSLESALRHGRGGVSRQTAEWSVANMLLTSVVVGAPQYLSGLFLDLKQAISITQAGRLAWMDIETLLAQEFPAPQVILAAWTKHLRPRA